VADDVQLMPSVGAPRDRSLTYARIYYPDTTLLRDARPIALDAGQEPTVTLKLTPTRAAQVAGRVIGADGTPARGDVLLRDPTLVSGGPMPRARLDAEGRFLFPTVWPGRYVFETTSNDRREYGAVTIDVFNDDVPDLVIKTMPSGTLRGQVVFEGGQPPAGAVPADFSVSAYFHADDAEHSADTHPADDWSFALTGVVGPSLVTAYGNRDNGWIVSRVTRDGAEVTRVPLQNADNLQVVMTRASTLEGAVVDRDGQRVSHCGILLFSEGTSESKRFVYVNQSDDAGEFRIEAVAPARYFVIALPNAIRDDVTAPASLDRLERHAARITIPPSGGVAIRLVLPLTEPEPE
jgi:hypothetical protein